MLSDGALYRAREQGPSRIEADIEKGKADKWAAVDADQRPTGAHFVHRAAGIAHSTCEHILIQRSPVTTIRGIFLVEGALRDQLAEGCVRPGFRIGSMHNSRWSRKLRYLGDRCMSGKKTISISAESAPHRAMLRSWKRCCCRRATRRARRDRSPALDLHVQTGEEKRAPRRGAQPRGKRYPPLPRHDRQLTAADRPRSWDGLIAPRACSATYKRDSLSGSSACAGWCRP